MTALRAQETRKPEQDASSSSLTDKKHVGLEKESGLERLGTEKTDSAESIPSSSSSSSSHEGEEVGVRPGRTVSRTYSEVYDGIRSIHDVEIGAEIEKEEPDPTDPNLVTWGPDDPGNPKAWTFKKKWGAVVIGSLPFYLSSLFDYC
jgi:hypothetical protein